MGDYYRPCLKAQEAPKVGRFGMLYRDYLRIHKKVRYSGLMLSGKPKGHIDRQAEDMFTQLVEQIKQYEEITEQLKSADQIEWVRRINSIRNRAEDIVEAKCCSDKSIDKAAGFPAA